MLNEIEQKIVKELGKDLPLCSEPFKEIAQRLGIEEAELLGYLNKMQESGLIRRMGAVLNHNNVGFTSNAMVVWDIDDDKVDDAGALLSSFTEISHCYRRRRSNRWKFNLYTMLHVKSKEECHKFITNIVNMINPRDYRVLFTIKEIKKTAMQYF